MLHAAYGDLSENSEYDEAKNEQAVVEARILTLENQLKNVKIIEKSDAVQGHRFPGQLCHHP